MVEWEGKEEEKRTIDRCFNSESKAGDVASSYLASPCRKLRALAQEVARRGDDQWRQAAAWQLLWWCIVAA